MKIKLLILFFGLLPITAFGQQLIGGKVTGGIFDKTVIVPLAGATVTVYSKNDSTYVSGAVTDQDGKYLVANLPSGVYYLVIKFLGYESQIVDFSISDARQEFNAGNIILSESTVALNDVTVTGTKPQIMYQDDKKILKVDEYRKIGATTLAQVLQNAPSITTDAEGNVYLRGSSNFTLLIDGKPAPTTGTNLIRQIPPEMVESIEIMTNPSAKYDPDGVTGIINLVLKKQKEAGFNGMVTTMAGLGNKYNGDAQFNYRKNKINLFGGVSGTAYQTNVSGILSRETGTPDGNLFMDTYLDQDVKIRTLNLNIGADFTFNEKNSLTVSSRLGPVNQSVNLVNRIFSDYTDAGLKDYSFYNNILKLDGFFYNPNVTFTHIFEKKGQKLQLSIFMGGFDGDLIQTLSQKTTDKNWIVLPGPVDQRESELNLGFNDTRFKADFESPVGENSKIEAGYQISWVTEETNNIFRNFNNSTGEWEINSKFTNLYNYNNYINAIYTTWSGKLKKYSYQLGLRAELNNRLFHQITLDEKFRYDKFSLFPSGNITRTLPKEQQLQFSYSRRIKRPGRNNLNPFPQFIDYQTIAQGNPYVKPEYVNSFELNYQKRIKTGFFSVQGYYRNVNDIITGIITTDGLGNVTMTSANANRSHSAGTELMANLQLKKWFRLMTSGNVYYNKLQDKTQTPSVDKDAVNWTFNSNMVFMFSPNTSFSLSGRYNGPSITIQGSQDGNFMLNTGLNQSLWKKKASLSLGVQDLLGTYRIKSKSVSENLVFNTDIRPEYRVVTLTFTYNFNNFQRRNAAQDAMDMNILR